MSKNFDKYFDGDGNVREEITVDNLWLKYLTETDNIYVNAERVKSINAISGRETIEYVMRTLDILDELIADENTLKRIISEVLKWSEVAKGGLEKERRTWKDKGYALDIHNEASASIYAENHITDESSSDEEKNRCRLIYILIKTHGLIGQCIRGEIPVSHNRELLLLNALTDEDIKGLLLILNECIIRAVSDDIWTSIKGDVKVLIDRIPDGDLSEYSAKYRLEKLCPREIDIYDDDAEFFEKNVFSKYELWYFTSALSDFDMGQIKTVIKNVLKQLEDKNVRHLNFKPLADSLYYDYEGKKHINVYKKRIIEKYILDASVQNVNLDVSIENGAAFVNFKFSPVCEKLIDFCVEAERSGLLTFEKSIIVLYDMFGFRRDAFDRLNNEDKYLDTMNDVASSTKDGIINYVVGESVVDVGSGGGILLDRLQEKYPEKTIIGTDISTNVIDALNQKKKKEGRSWNVRVHNFVDCPLEEKVDSIIFSSILHEIYSYTEGANGKFDTESVRRALRYAYDSLNFGGRIIIRDGIKTDSSELRKLIFKDKSGLDFFKNYTHDFKGLKDISDEKKVSFTDEESLTVIGDINFIREFMYTYTWGTESYAHEVQEQFGYFTLAEYKTFFEELGARIICADELLEPGYPDNLNKYLTLTDVDGNEVEYPASNCIVVVEKKFQ